MNEAPTPTYVYKIGDTVDEDGCYACVPCGSKRYLHAGERFPSCLHCLRMKDRKMFKRGLELWEKCRQSSMMNIINHNAQKLFPCPVCGLKYREEEIARQCEAWCRKHNSCNIEIIRHAVTEDAQMGGGANRNE